WCRRNDTTCKAADLAIFGHLTTILLLRPCHIAFSCEADMSIPRSLLVRDGLPSGPQWWRLTNRRPSMSAYAGQLNLAPTAHQAQRGCVGGQRQIAIEVAGPEHVAPCTRPWAEWEPRVEAGRSSSCSDRKSGHSLTSRVKAAVFSRLWCVTRTAASHGVS